MRINVSVDTAGIDFTKASSGLSRQIDKVTETYARKMANDSAGYAPVLNGFLRNSLVASVSRAQLMEWTWGSDLPYARRQEYEHKSRKAFVRRAIWQNEEEYKKTISRVVGEAMR